MTPRTARAISSVERATLDALLTLEATGFDGLRLAAPPFVPEVRLHLADDPVILWARMEAGSSGAVAQPFWASAWAGGQALARYILDHPEVVAGRRVLDVAAGSGLVAIAAAKAGAAAVTANDIDPYALAALALNAEANGVAVAGIGGDLLGAEGDEPVGGARGAEVVLAGDVFYSASMAVRMLSFLERAAAAGALVLVGDPGRDHLPRGRLELVTSYRVSMLGAPQDAERTQAHVLRARPGVPVRAGAKGHLGMLTVA